MAQLVKENELKSVIDGLEDLTDKQREFIKERWLNYVLWWDERSRSSKWKYYTFRTIVVIGGVTIPALIGTAAARDLSNLTSEQAGAIQWVAFVLSLIVGISAALEELFRFGEIWRDKRAATELLKVEGWCYFQLIGKYKDQKHAEAYPEFASIVENMIGGEIKGYISMITPKK